MTPERLPNAKLYFRFYGDCFDPSEISQRLGIEPTVEFRPGDPITEDGKGRRRGYGWFVKVGGRDTLDIEDMLQELRERVAVPGATIRQLCDDLGVEAIVVCGVDQPRSAQAAPALFFPADFIQWAAEAGVSLNVDVRL